MIIPHPLIPLTIHSYPHLTTLTNFIMTLPTSVCTPLYLQLKRHMHFPTNNNRSTTLAYRVLRMLHGPFVQQLNLYHCEPLISYIHEATVEMTENKIYRNKKKKKKKNPNLLVANSALILQISRRINDTKMTSNYTHSTRATQDPISRVAQAQGGVVKDPPY